MGLRWYELGELLGKIISPIVMAFVYFLIITLLALTLRLFGKDLLNTKFNSKIAYWINRKQILLQWKNSSNARFYKRVLGIFTG